MALILLIQNKKPVLAPLTSELNLNESSFENIIQTSDLSSSTEIVNNISVTQNSEEIKTEIVEPVINEEIADDVKTDRLLLTVPFTSQAPFGDWQDEKQQDGCEEASVLMAIKWARKEALNRDIALKEILAASDYLLKNYGEYRDTNLDAVLNWLIKDYFNYEQAEIKKDITLLDLITELENGRVIIAPMNGQALKNPNFTSPGPINHMLLIRGYDKNKKTFITNDPGTRNGELYEYPENILYSALRTYPTGYNEENINPEKNIIVFWR